MRRRACAAGRGPSAAPASLGNDRFRRRPQPLPASRPVLCYTGYFFDQGVLCYGEGNQYVYGAWREMSSRDLGGDLHWRQRCSSNRLLKNSDFDASRG
jgi:hypothetical protein